MQKVASVAIQIVCFLIQNARNRQCYKSLVFHAQKKKRALLRVKTVFHYKTFKITLFFLTQ